MNHIQQNIKSVREKVIKKIGNPVNPMVVLATLESFGIREKDVFVDYGFVTIQDLAHDIFKELKDVNPAELKNSLELKKANKTNKKKSVISISDYLWVKTRLFAQYYPLGIFHLMPIFLQIAAIIFFGYSLWTFIGFNIIQSTAVVFGVILGLILSGGYVQVMGRQATFYWHHEEYGKAKMVIDRMINSGIKGILTAFIAIGLVNFFFHLYPFAFVLVIMGYAFLIGVLLLVVAPFHTIKKRWVISLAVLVGTSLALLLHFSTNIHVYLTHWIGILSAIIVAKLFLIFFLKSKTIEDLHVDTRPKKLTIIYRNYPYFFYGTFIYLFVFIDRILAWSADLEHTKQFIFLYEKDYEIGMDLAILMFFMLAGVMEYSIASFSKFMDIRQKNTLFLNRNKFNKAMSRMYWWHVMWLFVTAIVVTGLIYLIITEPWGYEAIFGEKLGFLSVKTCILGSIGYFFFSWGMLNALYLFTLNQPKGPLYALFASCIVNFLIGFSLSRFFSYEFSVVGMVVGSFIFMILTLRENLEFFSKLDYHYYAAY